MFRTALLLLLAVVKLSGPTSACFAAERNIILFVTDDMGPDAGCYGNGVIKTPHLDALAKDGIRMTSAFCTTASCSASRSVILTGIYNHANAQYGHEHSYHHFRTFDNIKSLPVRLTEAGYRTARIGKLHVGPEEIYKFGQALPGNPRSPVQMADNCRELIAAKSDQPFFLYFCTTDPHRSGGGEANTPAATPVERALKADPFGNRPQGYPGVTEVKYDPKEVLVPPFLPDTKACREELAQYYQSVSRIDQGLGRLMQILKESGHYDDTLVIFTSDHGIAFPGAKTNLYEPGMKVPMVVREGRGQRAEVREEKTLTPALSQRERGRTCDAMVCHADLTPTILEYAGVTEKVTKPPAVAIQGKSFLSALRDEKAKGFDVVYASHTFHEITMYYPMKVVRTRTHKLIWNIAHPLPFPFASDLWDASTWQDAYRRGPETMYGKRTVKAYIHRPQFELYDLVHDPDEVKNLAADPGQAKLLDELKGKIKAFQKRTDDPWILKWDYE